MHTDDDVVLDASSFELGGSSDQRLLLSGDPRFQAILPYVVSGLSNGV
jgi:hypothetical protein